MLNYYKNKQNGGGVMGYKIREARKSLGMSQDDLSKKAQVSRSVISGLESGRKIVTTTETLNRIASALEMSINDIFFS